MYLAGMDGGGLEVKSIKRENIQTLNKVGFVKGLRVQGLGFRVCLEGDGVLVSRRSHPKNQLNIEFLPGFQGT